MWWKCHFLIPLQANTLICDLHFVFQIKRKLTETYLYVVEFQNVNFFYVFCFFFKINVSESPLALSDNSTKKLYKSTNEQIFLKQIYLN